MTTRSIQSALTPNEVYEYCCLIGQNEQLRIYPCSLLGTPESLMWSMAVSLSHSFEIALRTFVPQQCANSQEPRPPAEFLHRIGQYLPNGRLPSKDLLYTLWVAWHKQHENWSEHDTLEAPVRLVASWNSFARDGQELKKVTPLEKRQVFRSVLGLDGIVRDINSRTVADDNVRHDLFLTAMQRTLKRTVGRSLIRKSITGEDPFLDVEHVALAGAIKKLRRDEAFISKGLRKSYETETVLQFPSLPIRGMEDNALVDFQRLPNTYALDWLAELLPGVMGMLEKWLSDSAHSAQKGMKRMVKAEKRGGKLSPDSHVSITPSSDTDGEHLERIDPADERNNPLQEIEATEEEIGNTARTRAILEEAIRRHGVPGEIFIRALLRGDTQKEAGRLAGWTPVTANRKLKALRNISVT
jgi:hypothetical protein